MQSCFLFSEKEPEELIKLKHAILNNKNPKKLADYIANYGYFDLINGTILENLNTSIEDEVLWKKQLLQSCDMEIFIEENYKFLDTQELRPLLAASISQQYVSAKEITSSITILSNYDSLREYERTYTTGKSKQQEKRLESFIRVGNKWLYLTTSSYAFANLEMMTFDEIPFDIIIQIMDLLRMHNYYYLFLSKNTSYFFQDSLYRYNESIKTKLERDVNIGVANLNRDMCVIQPVSFAIDSLNNIHILPKNVYGEPVDYELIKHYLIRSIQANYDCLQLRKNWAYCMDLLVYPEKMLP